MKIRELDNLQQKLERLKLLSGLSGYGNHAGAKRAVEIAIVSPNSKWSGKVEKFLGSQIDIPLDLIHPFLPGPEVEELPQDGVLVGHVADSKMPVRIPLGSFSQGMFIGGTTGSGKSYTSGYISDQLIEQGINVWLFDRHCEYQRYLAKHIQSKMLIVLKHQDLKRNLFELLPGENPKEGINRIVSGFRGAVFLRDGSENVLASLLHKAYIDLGIYEGSKQCPSLSEIYDRVCSLTFRREELRNIGYKETLVNRMTALMNQMAETYDCMQGFDIGELLNRSIIWQLEGLSELLYRLFVEDLLRVALAYRLRFPVDGIKNVFVIDEAHELLSGSEERDDLSLPYVYRFARTTRKRGIGLVLADQTPSEIPSSVMANMGTRLILRIINGRCIRAVAESMSLTPEQGKYLPELKPRQAVIHFLAKPFLIQIPEIQFDGQITQVASSQLSREEINKLNWVPANHWNEIQVNSENDKHDSHVSKAETDYLLATTKHPFTPVTELDRLLSISLWKGHELRRGLESKGCIEIHKIKTGRKGNPISIMEITPDGYELLKRLKVAFQKPQGIGSWRHKFWQHEVQAWYEANFPICKTAIEDKGVDVAVYLPNEKVAVEILIEGEAKEINNIKRDLQDFDIVICCCEESNDLQSLKQLVEKEFNENQKKRLQFKLLRDLLNAPSPSHSSGSVDKNK